MRQHPIWGEQIGGFARARIAAGTTRISTGPGTPIRLAGIHAPEARIVRVADAFDAITHTRPYQQARSVEEALQELDRFAGRQFDPELVRLQIDLVRGDRVAEEVQRARLVVFPSNRVAGCVTGSN
jgi:response regulator RpfG family c-di-GMP phosphodiesterase